MKYIVYVEYNGFYDTTTYEYIVLKAKFLEAAVSEADEIFDHKKMNLIRILEKTGNPEKVESDIKVQLYTAILEKCSTKWTEFTKHKALHFKIKTDNFIITV